MNRFSRSGSTLRILRAWLLALAIPAASIAAPSVLDVTVFYEGDGAVDDRHAIVVLVFDGPTPGQPPTRLIGARWSYENGGTVSFDRLAADPVYIAALYDLRGGLSGLNIPSGTPLGLYALGGSVAPTAVRPEPGTRIDLVFDDTQTMPERPGGEEPLASLLAAEQGIVEVRMYTVKEGRREDFVRFFEKRTLAPQVGAGMRMLGQFRSLEDENLFVWIRSFPTQEERVRQLRAFYMGETWIDELSSEAAELIESTEVMLVEPTARSTMR